MNNSLPGFYAVIGHPIGHSLSPAMHNAGFKDVGFSGFMAAFDVTDIQSAVSGIRALGFKGAAITIPHKVSVMPFLDDVDPTAKEIGAVNTITNHDGFLRGCNSDVNGAITALLEKTNIKGKRVAIIGAGGAARAVAYGVIKEKGEVTLYNRTRNRGMSLAAALNVPFFPLNDIETLECDILINTTSVGMHPYVKETPVSGNLLKKAMVVMDIVYRPLKTQLLLLAEEKGCLIIDGLSMFIHQAAFQFYLWTGIPAPTQTMRQTVSHLLGEA